LKVESFRERIRSMKARLVQAGLFLAVCTVAAAGEPARTARKPLELSAEFAAARDEIAPRAAEELWKKIPWKTSLLEARQVAAREGKPIFLWSMDGHPLCLG